MLLNKWLVHCAVNQKSEVLVAVPNSHINIKDNKVIFPNFFFVYISHDYLQHEEAVFLKLHTARFSTSVTLYEYVCLN